MAPGASDAKAKVGSRGSRNPSSSVNRTFWSLLFHPLHPICSPPPPLTNSSIYVAVAVPSLTSAFLGWNSVLMHAEKVLCHWVAPLKSRIFVFASLWTWLRSVRSTLWGVGFWSPRLETEIQSLVQCPCPSSYKRTGRLVLLSCSYLPPPFLFEHLPVSAFNF